ncbi:MAG: tRNA pseudouridine(55) synthase TruB [Sphingomonadales bacterium]
MRHKKGNPINGWLVIDKPLNMTSTDVVRAVRRDLKPQKLGHAGTLDPLASGILPIGMGEATKTMPYIVDSSKVYEFEVTWGQERNTDDLEGKISNQSDKRPSEQDISKILPTFVGKIIQTPPKFSAIKINGQRAFKLAREGKKINIPPRVVTVFELKNISNDLIINSNLLITSSFQVTCGKGTYVRSLARDMGRLLGVYGFVSKLRRLRVGPFVLKNAISLELLNELSHSAPARDYVLPVMTALDDILALAVTESEAKLIKNGQPLHIPNSAEGKAVLTLNEVLIALVEIKHEIAQPFRIFNLA